MMNKRALKESHGEVNVNPITVNRVPIGEACSPYEVIQMQTDWLFPVVIIYDTGSDVSPCNDEAGPIIANIKEESMRMAISTINSERTMLMQA